MRLGLVICLMPLLAWPATGQAADADFDCPAQLRAPGYCGDGRAAARSGLYRPLDVAAAPDGSLLILDGGNEVVRRRDPSGTITTWHPSKFATSLAALPDGAAVYTRTDHDRVMDIRNGEAGYFAGVGNAGYLDALDPVHGLMRAPRDLAVTPDGAVLIADTGNHRVRVVRPGQGIATLAGNGRLGAAGDGGPALSASLERPRAVAAMPDGTVVVATAEGRLRQILPDGTIRRIGTTDLLRGVTLAALADGTVAVGDARRRRILKVAMDGTAVVVASGGGCGIADADRTPTSAGLNLISGIAALPDGSLAVADAGSHRVLRVTGSSVEVLAGGGLRPPPRCRPVPRMPWMPERPQESAKAVPPPSAGFTDVYGSTQVDISAGCSGRRGRRFNVNFAYTKPVKPRARRPFEAVYFVGVKADVRVQVIGRTRRTVASRGVAGKVVLRLPGLPAGRYKLRFAAAAKGQVLCLRTSIRVR